MAWTDKERQYIKNDCGDHWSSHGGKCRKCAYLAKYYHKNRHKLQAGRTSGATLIGEVAQQLPPWANPRSGR